MKNKDLKKSAEQVFQYHEQTKHNYNRYAKSSGYMDWKNQPNPFRFYSDTNLVKLPFLKQDPEISHQGLFSREKNYIQEINLENISAMMELSLSLSACK